MLIRPDANAANPSTVTPVMSSCGHCGMEERRLLHHVRIRGSLRRLCTSCVLILHPQSFCPTCFQVFPPAASNDSVISCSKCHSSSHSHCVGGSSTSSLNPYVCPLCIHSNTPIFKLGREISEGQEFRVMNRDAAKKLLAAAKIASFSMNKAAIDARSEAEKRAKEAAFARKRAKEALEYVANMVARDKLRKTEVAGPSGSGFRGGISASQFKRGNNVIVNSRNGLAAIGGSGVAMVVDKRISASGNGDKLESSNQVLAALNAVELRENEKIGGIKARSLKQGINLNGGRAAMDVDERGRTGARTAETVGVPVAGRINGGSDHMMFSDTHRGEDNLIMPRDNELEDMDDDVVVVEPTANNKVQ